MTINKEVESRASIEAHLKMGLKRKGWMKRKSWTKQQGWRCSALRLGCNPLASPP